MLLRRITSAAVLAAITLAMLASCAGENSVDSTTANASGTVATTEAPTEDLYDPGLPDADFGGYEFRVLNFNQEAMWWVYPNIDIESPSADVVDSAVYNRNRSMEQKYGFKIVEMPVSIVGMDQMIRKSVSAGTDDYDIALVNTTNAPANASNNRFLELTDLPNLNLDKDWWNPEQQKYFSIANKLFFTFSDLSFIDDDNVTIQMYNKKLAADLGVESAEQLYSLVEDGKYTLDVFDRLTKAGANDINGNGIVDGSEDQFGAIIVEWEYLALFFGFGEPLFDKDKDDLPYMSAGSERFYTAYQKTAETIGNKKIFAIEGQNGITRTEEVFVNDRALFCTQVLSCVRLYKEMGSDFGILPTPKLDEKQERYYTNCLNAAAVAILSTVADPGRTSHILEALTAESRRTVVPAYYNIAIGNKYLRDDESFKMLDIILDSRFIDMGSSIYGWGGLSGLLQQSATSRRTDFASILDKASVNVQKAIDKTIETYKEIS
ncbi:hypothetical protein FACS1894219_02410 [Clostridia bacterium]|nr:hypothetical protein FACS1894219_02410 [Clostridia bacterium]